jgi:hypothetical protein
MRVLTIIDRTATPASTLCAVCSANLLPDGLARDRARCRRGLKFRRAVDRRRRSNRRTDFSQAPTARIRLIFKQARR